MFILDTNVFCDPTAARPSVAVERWLSQQAVFGVSAMTVLEFEFGIARLVEGAKKQRLSEWFEDTLRDPAVRVIAIDTAVARAAGRLQSATYAAGRPRPIEDLLIAATALVTGGTVATRNTKDFDGLGLPVLNPFEWVG